MHTRWSVKPAFAAPARACVRPRGGVRCRKKTFSRPARAREYYAIVSEPKSLKSYEAPHALNAEARRDRIAFRAEELSLKPPDPAAIARIPELVQPPEAK